MLNHVQFCDLKDCSAPCFSVPGISQARTLEWVAIPFSSGSSQPRDWTASLPLADRVLTTELSGKPCIVYIYTPGTISVQLILVFAIVKKNLLFLKATKQCQVQFSSVQSLSYVQFFATPWTAAWQAFLSIANSWSLLKLMSIESVMPSNYPTLCRSLFLPPSFFPSIRVFSDESVLCIRWPKYWSYAKYSLFCWLLTTTLWELLSMIPFYR